MRNKLIAILHDGKEIVVGKFDKFVKCERGESHMDTATKIVIAVVIGALVLALIYALWGDIIIEVLTQRVRDMFNYTGG